MQLPELQNADAKILQYRLSAESIAPPELIQIEAPFGRPPTSPSAEASIAYKQKQNRQFKKISFIGLSATCGTISALMATQGQMGAAIALALVAGCSAAAITLLAKEDHSEHQQRFLQVANTLNKTIHSLQDAVPVHEISNDRQRVLDEISAMESARSELELAVQPFEQKRRATQMASYLAARRLMPSGVPGINQRDIAILEAAGISTAGDIANSPLADIKGIGAAKQSHLKNWVEQERNRHVYDPVMASDEIATISNALAPHLELLKNACAKAEELLNRLQLTAQRIASPSEANDQELRAAARALAQARYDLAHLGVSEPLSMSPQPRMITSDET